MKTLLALQKRASKIGARVVPDIRQGCYNYYDRENAHAWCVSLREVEDLLDSAVGWHEYMPQPFAENLDHIAKLVGSSCYEVMERDGRCFVRRA